jgi:hypothetical protein
LNKILFKKKKEEEEEEEEKLPYYLFWLKTNPNIKMISLAGH